MASLQFLAIFLISSWCLFGFSQGAIDLHDDGGGIPPCLQKILPCQPYTKSPEKPPASCCVPVKHVVAHEIKCVCSVLNNETLLKAFNITQTEALKLAHACGAHIDMNTCKHVADAPSTGPPPPPGSSTSIKANGSSKKIPMDYGFAAITGFFVAASIFHTFSVN